MNPHPSPPEDLGKRLITLPRTTSDGKPQELRFSIASYEGREFVAVRLWEAGLGGMWPTRTGITIRRGELVQALRALETATQELGLAPRRGEAVDARVDHTALYAGPKGRRPAQQGFDEFGE